jgi:hypothetical protein
MRRLPIVALCAAFALPAVATAHDYGRPLPPPLYRPVRWAPPPPHRDWDDHYRYARRSPYRYYGYDDHHHRHHHDNDDVLWAIGGLAAGVIIGNAIESSYVPPPAPPPRHR